jgi:hypothetical protein
LVHAPAVQLGESTLRRDGGRRGQRQLHAAPNRRAHCRDVSQRASDGEDVAGIADERLVNFVRECQLGGLKANDANGIGDGESKEKLLGCARCWMTGLKLPQDLVALAG